MTDQNLHELVRSVRQAATNTDTAGRAELSRQINDAIYDAEKYSYAVNPTDPAADTAARDLFGKICDAAHEAWTHLIAQQSA